ncbi:TLDc domain-containing protein [Naegleria gruberi]|uniref:TLDc domain-containing protein n=1 Tax=Naegleria gruberi TaxID=5762 RepID=D2V867_NAEGR|nr:TLDc domain-containing protein [Naegleria gruberi]EFC46993.1 TLDc domain-containing protein [Naegleria gruberi]|eukprot:XP_002679737.1 TLDc domain-containing protein [Naegleria gruberi strain NEG-M]
MQHVDTLNEQHVDDLHHKADIARSNELELTPEEQQQHEVKTQVVELPLTTTTDKTVLMNNHQPIHLNLRGTIMTVSLSTFYSCKRELEDNFFMKMFSGEQPIYRTNCQSSSEPIYFIDCDPIVFKSVLDWLQYGIVKNNELSGELKNACKLFKLSTIVNILENRKLSYLNFSNCEFQNLTLKGMYLCNFTNAKFVKCYLKFKSRDYCTIDKCEFIDCVLNSTCFTRDFSKTNLSLKNNNTFNGCRFKDLNLTRLKSLSQFNGCIFESCSFSFENFSEKQIENSTFEKVDFKNQNLKGFTFKNVELINCYNFIGHCECDSEGTFQFCNSTLIPNSFIYSKLFTSCKSKSIPKLLYRGTIDGFKAKNFHSKCDNAGPTLVIIKSEHDELFGGFTTQNWKSPTNDYAFGKDNSAFIFKIIPENENYQFQKFDILKNKQKHAIYLDNNYLSSFGAYGCDICIKDDCNLNSHSFSKFGCNYELPDGFKTDSFEAHSYLAGSYEFRVVEIEVFKIRNQ